MRINRFIYSFLTLCILSISSFGQEQWLGMYMGTQKVGYMHYKMTPTSKGVKTVSDMKMQMAMLGAKTEILMRSTSITDTKHHPKQQDIKMVSAGRETKISAIYFTDHINVHLDAQGSVTDKKVVIPAGIELTDDATFGSGEAAAMKDGAKTVTYALNPVALSLDKMITTVKSHEKITIEGKEEDVVKLETVSPQSTSTSWVKANGQLMKMNTVLGISAVSESKDEAMRITPSQYTPPKDLAFSSALNLDKAIPNPRKAKELSLSLSDSPQTAKIPSDYRQTLSKTETGWKLDIHAEEFTGEAQALPISGVEPAWLETADYMPVADKRIVNLAHEIKGDETDSYKVVVKIHDWVHSHMTPNAGIAVPRAATEILKTKEGVCRDYAILTATLARAAGVPAKVCSGLVALDRRFFYHAWVECYVGKWVPVDSTLEGMFVDATHIKIAEGDAGKALSLGTLDGVTIKVLSSH